MRQLLSEAADAIEQLCNLCADQSKDCSKAAAKYLELWAKQPRWIPVAERLPEEYTTILFVSSSGQVHVGYYDSEHKGFCDMTGFRYVCTHWMLAPQPPEEES